MTGEEIEKELEQVEENYMNKMEKSICRLIVFGEGNRFENDDYLKPYCLD